MLSTEESISRRFLGRGLGRKTGRARHTEGAELSKGQAAKEHDMSDDPHVVQNNHGLEGDVEDGS